jgi:hypothetical protein
VPPGGLSRPAIPGCLSAALRHALALSGWPPRVFARPDIHPSEGGPASRARFRPPKIGQQYCPIQNMAEAGQLDKSALTLGLFATGEKGRKRALKLLASAFAVLFSAMRCSSSGPRVVRMCNGGMRPRPGFNVGVSIKRGEIRVRREAGGLFLSARLAQSPPPGPSSLAVAGNEKNDGDDRAGASDKRSGDEPQIDTELRAEERQYDEEANQDYQAVRFEPGDSDGGRLR